MNRKFSLCLFLLAALPSALHAGTVTPLHDGWRLQSACKLTAGGDVIAAAGFQVDDWLKTSVPSTVLAAQVAAGLVPDPYYGDNLRKHSRHQLSDRAQLRQSSHAPGQSLSLRLVVSHRVRRSCCGKEREQILAALRRHQLSRRNLGQRQPHRGLDRRSPAPIAPTTSM